MSHERLSPRNTAPCSVRRHPRSREMRAAVPKPRTSLRVWSFGPPIWFGVGSVTPEAAGSSPVAPALYTSVLRGVCDPASGRTRRRSSKTRSKMSPRSWDVCVGSRRARRESGRRSATNSIRCAPQRRRGLISGASLDRGERELAPPATWHWSGSGRDAATRVTRARCSAAPLAVVDRRRKTSFSVLARDVACDRGCTGPTCARSRTGQAPVAVANAPPTVTSSRRGSRRGTSGRRRAR
jgi:hypothetical protein